MDSTDLPPFDDFVPQRRFAAFVAVSPDGERVAYGTSDGGYQNLWVAPLASPADARPLTSFIHESVRAAAWSPDGSTLAFAADRDGDEQYQIYVIPADGGDPRRISTADGRQHSLADDPFTPDGKHLIFAGNDRDETVQDLVIVELASGDVRRVESQPGELMFALGVSPDGRWLLGGVARSNTDVDAFVVDLADDEPAPRVITAHDGEQRNAPAGWLPDSSGFLLITDAERDFSALVECTLDGRQTVIVEPDWDVEAVDTTDDHSTLIWSVNESGMSSLYVRTADGSRRIPVETGVLGAHDITPDGAALIALFGTGSRPPELTRIDVAAGELTRLTDSAPPALARITPVDPELVEYPTHDGRNIPGWLYRPVGADEPCPILLSIHGGPEAQERAEYMYSGLYQFLLSRGIGVFAPNVRGSTGYGTRYQTLIHRDWGGDELGDFEHAVRYLSGLDWVDSDRIGVFGGSFGGFATLSCVSRLPDLFAVGVSIVGPSNLVTLTRSVPPTWRALMKQWVGDPDEDEEFLMERSPISYVDQIVAPLMVVQGANDPRVVKAESDQIVEALRARGVEVRYDVYDDEGHGFTKRANEIKAVGDVSEFLVTQLR